MGEKIKARRKELGLTQEELAIKSRVSRQTIVSIENGTGGDVLIGTITAIADALEIPIEFFFIP